MILALIVGMRFACPGHPKLLYLGVYNSGWSSKAEQVRLYEIPNSVSIYVQRWITHDVGNANISGITLFPTWFTATKYCGKHDTDFHFCRQANRNTTRYDDVDNDDDDEDQITHFASILNWHFGLFKN